MKAGPDRDRAGGVAPRQRRAPDPGAAPLVTRAQILAALRGRRERRGRMMVEIGGTLAALTRAVDRHVGQVEELRRAIEAQGGDLEPLRFYDTLMARFRSELRSAERTLANVFREAAEDAATRV